MTTTTNTTIRASEKTTALLSVLFMAVLGGAILFAAGHAQSATLHDAAHDIRHATGFPCH
ncbi:MAG: CbtB-domain containing protein [Rhodobacteraceae bacterium]|nr:CbtB-domain containing protein [Paracoccaceae bacterium]